MLQHMVSRAIILMISRAQTRSPLATFFLAMATHPHVQKKAQKDIDNLLGENCLPTLRDRPKLQYIEAIMRECFRWRPVTPLGFPHSTLSDDMINGYHIPKGQ
jgi:cytochrome P450